MQTSFYLVNLMKFTLKHILTNKSPDVGITYLIKIQLVGKVKNILEEIKCKNS